MADPLELAKVIGIPIFGAVTGWITAALKTAGRVTDLEKAIAELKKSTKEQLENLVSAWKLEVSNNKEDVHDKFEELKKEVKELERSFDLFTRASHHDFADNEAFTRYVEEMNRQWKVVERTLGQIEGWMKAQKKSPSSFPPRPGPR